MGDQDEAAGVARFSHVRRHLAFAGRVVLLVGLAAGGVHGRGLAARAASPDATLARAL